MSAIMSTGCSSRARVLFPHPHDGSQAPASPFPADTRLLRALLCVRHATLCTYMCAHFYGTRWTAPGVDLWPPQVHTQTKLKTEGQGTSSAGLRHTQACSLRWLSSAHDAEECTLAHLAFQDSPDKSSGETFQGSR